MNRRSLPAKRSSSAVLAEPLLHCHCLVRVAKHSPDLGAGGRLIVAIPIVRSATCGVSKRSSGEVVSFRAWGFSVGAGRVARRASKAVGAWLGRGSAEGH